MSLVIGCATPPASHRLGQPGGLPGGFLRFWFRAGKRHLVNYRPLVRMMCSQHIGVPLPLAAPGSMYQRDGVEFDGDTTRR